MVDKENEKLVKKPKSVFLKVKCDKCGSSQTVFSASSTKVECFKCGANLVKPGASKAKIKSKTVLNEFKDY